MWFFIVYKPLIFFAWWINSRCMCLNKYHQLLFSIRSWNVVCFVYVSSTIFFFNCCRLMDNPHSCIARVHLITLAPSFAMSTPLGPIFLDLVFPFKWLENELKIMFHVLLALLNECIHSSTTCIVVPNASSKRGMWIHVVDVWFN